MKITAEDPMKYLDTMEAVDSDIMDKVLNVMNHYDYHRYTCLLYTSQKMQSSFIYQIHEYAT